MAHELDAAKTREELKRRLDQAEARYRALVERVPVVVYTAAVGVRGTFSSISPRVKALLGFTPDQWLSDPRLWLKRLHPEDRRRLLPLLAKTSHAGTSFSAEYRMIDRAGRVRWVRDESQAIRDAGGRAFTIQGTWTEISELKRLRAELAEKDRRLASTRTEIEQFVAAASHELKAPLRRIVNLAETLARRSPDLRGAGGGDLLESIRASAAELQGLIAALVRYGELDRDVSAPSRVAADRALERALHALKEAVDAAGAVVTQTPLPEVSAEPALLEKVFFNLIDNALKFRGPEAPRIHVSALRSGDEWIVSVRDNGIGLHGRQAERIFSLFQRLNARGEYPGAGLGLAACRKILGRWGGRIWAESEPGEGATFRFALPALPENPS